jgi:hypothetical protein
MRLASPVDHRSGTDYERVVDAVNNALARQERAGDLVLFPATRLAELTPVAEMSPPTFTLQPPASPTLRQASLF